MHGLVILNSLDTPFFQSMLGLREEKRTVRGSVETQDISAPLVNQFFLFESILHRMNVHFTIPFVRVPAVLSITTEILMVVLPGTAFR